MNIEVETPKKQFKIVISHSYKIFKEKVEKSLSQGWILHGYTQHPLQIVTHIGEKEALPGKGQWSQAFIKNIF